MLETGPILLNFNQLKFRYLTQIGKLVLLYDKYKEINISGGQFIRL